MSKSNVDRAALHRYVNCYLAQLIPLPQSPIQINYEGYVFVVEFERIDDRNWANVKIK